MRDITRNEKNHEGNLHLHIVLVVELRFSLYWIKLCHVVGDSLFHEGRNYVLACNDDSARVNAES